jgi:hypothetical protein
VFPIVNYNFKTLKIMNPFSMYRLKNSLKLGICTVLLTGLWAGCSSDDSDPDVDGNCVANFNWLNSVSSEINALTNAAAAYAEDQSEANCDAYQGAALNYLDALEDALDCVTGTDRSALEDAIDEARADVNEGICN